MASPVTSLALLPRVIEGVLELPTQELPLVKAIVKAQPAVGFAQSRIQRYEDLFADVRIYDAACDYVGAESGKNVSGPVTRISVKGAAGPAAPASRPLTSLQSTPAQYAATTEALLREATRSDNKRIRDLGEKAFAAIEAVRQAIRDNSESEQLRKEIAALEAKLAAARAKLPNRGRGGAMSPEAKVRMAEQRRRMNFERDHEAGKHTTPREGCPDCEATS